MDLETMVTQARTQVREARRAVEKEIGKLEGQLGKLKTALTDLGAGSGRISAKRAPKKSAPQNKETTAVKVLATLPKSFDIDMARKAFGKQLGVSLAQLSRRGALRKIKNGYLKIAASAVILLAAASMSSAADLPPHAVAIDNFGTWSCERGYVLRDHWCVSDAEVKQDQVIVSDLPSAGEGSKMARSCPSGGCAQSTPQTIIVERPSGFERYYSHDEYDGPLPDGVYRHLQGTLGPNARVVPFH